MDESIESVRNFCRERVEAVWTLGEDVAQLERSANERGSRLYAMTDQLDTTARPSQKSQRHRAHYAMVLFTVVFSI